MARSKTGAPFLNENVWTSWKHQVLVSVTSLFSRIGLCKLFDSASADVELIPIQIENYQRNVFAFLFMFTKGPFILVDDVRIVARWIFFLIEGIYLISFLVWCFMAGLQFSETETGLVF